MARMSFSLRKRQGFSIYGPPAVDSMSPTVSVNPKCVTKEYSYLIRFRMDEDHLLINDQMTECAIERNKNVIDLSVDYRLVKPANVCERELVAKHSDRWVECGLGRVWTGE